MSDENPRREAIAAIFNRGRENVDPDQVVLPPQTPGNPKVQAICYVFDINDLQAVTEALFFITPIAREADMDPVEYLVLKNIIREGEISLGKAQGLRGNETVGATLAGVRVKGSPLRLCHRCEEKAARVMVLPCGHLALCEDCSDDVSSCPACNVKIRRHDFVLV